MTLAEQNGSSEKQVALLVNADVPTIAFGLYHIAAFLKKEGLKCLVHQFEDTPSLFEVIAQNRIKVIGFSIHWHSQLIPGIKLAQLVKMRFPECVVVAGGLTASYYAQDIIEFDAIDYVVVGDGEVPFFKIVLEQDPALIPNLIWKSKDQTVYQNPITYETSVQDLREFVYDNELDFLSTRQILKMGKGCFYSCFHCGGRHQAFKDRGIDRPVVFKPEDITHVVRQNYEKLLFKHLYLAQDHYRDLKNLSKGLIALPDAMTRQISLTVAAWGIPAIDQVRQLCTKFASVCIELTFDSMDPSLLWASRGYTFSSYNPEEEMLDYLDQLFNIENLEILIFFSYPHIINGQMLFPDYKTMQMLMQLEQVFRQYHLIYRMGFCYMLLSTDPGSKYGQDISMASCWENLRKTQGGFGSFCMHYKEHMAPDEFSAHHLFIQVFMKMFEVLSNLIQYLYQVEFKSDIKRFYTTLFEEFNTLYQDELKDELKGVQSYAQGHSYLGYTCLRQENVHDAQLSNFIFRFIRACCRKQVIAPEFDFLKYVFACQENVDQARYRSCVQVSSQDLAQNPLRTKSYPLVNPLLNIFTKVNPVAFFLCHGLHVKSKIFILREHETCCYLLPYFSIQDLVMLSHSTDSTFIRAMGGDPGVKDEPDDPQNLFARIYQLSKTFSVKNAKCYGMMVKTLLDHCDRKDIASMHKAVLQRQEIKPSDMPPVNYAATEKTRQLIPLNDQELFILDRCNGLARNADIGNAFCGEFNLDPYVFDTIMRFFHINRFVI